MILRNNEYIDYKNYNEEYLITSDDKSSETGWPILSDDKCSETGRPIEAYKCSCSDTSKYSFKPVKSRENSSGISDSRFYTEKRKYIRPRLSLLLNKIIIFYFSLFSIQCSANCDFKGSGLDLDGKSVQPAYLSCNAGKVEWQYPRAALRIILQLPGGDHDFYGCIKASPDIQGARLFVEGHRSLLPLFSKDDGQPKDKVRCFTSYRGRAALYLEAEIVPSFKELKASFEYDLQPLSNGKIFDPLEECRPCSHSELVRLYCSADFAARGFIVSTEEDDRLQLTRVTLAASKVFQETQPVFSKGHDTPIPSNLVSKEGISSVPQGDRYGPLSNHIHTDKGPSTLLGNLYMPSDCGARAGPGEFLVLGSIRFGQPVLKCAPRLEEWKKVVSEVTSERDSEVQTGFDFRLSPFFNADYEVSALKVVNRTLKLVCISEFLFEVTSIKTGIINT